MACNDGFVAGDLTSPHHAVPQSAHPNPRAWAGLARRLQSPFCGDQSRLRGQPCPAGLQTHRAAPLGALCGLPVLQHTAQPS